MRYFPNLILLVATSFTLTTATEEYEIDRKKSGDRFKFPTSLCTSNWKEKCAGMGGMVTKKNCTCKCTNHNNNVFGYFGSSWKCTSNKEVRQNYSGCTFVETILEKTHLNSVLQVVKTGNSYIGQFKKFCNDLESPISYLKCNGKWQRFHNDSSIGFYSHFNPHTGYYDELYHNGIHSLQQYTPAIYGRVIRLKVKCYDAAAERIYCVLLKVQGKQHCKVDLPTTATSPSSLTTSTTKIQTITSKPESSIPPSTSQTTVAKGTTRKLTTVSSYETSTTTTTTSTTIDISSIIPTGRASETTVEPATSQKITNSPQKQEDDSTHGNDNSAGAIGGAIGGVAALVIILLIILFVVLRRKRCPQAKQESVTVREDNPSYNSTIQINGQLDFTDDEYSYAYTNNHPVVIKNQNGEAITGSDVANGHIRNLKGLSGSRPTDEAPIYNTLEDTDGVKRDKYGDVRNGGSSNASVHQGNLWATSQGPVYDVLEDPSLNASTNVDSAVYNTLQDPNYAKLDVKKTEHDPYSYNVLMRDLPFKTRRGPVYDVFQDPNSSVNKDDLAPSNGVFVGEHPTNKAQGPVYDVLENPNSTDGPLYSILEDPNSNGQQALYAGSFGKDPHVYDSLQEHDPNVYDGLYSPIWKSSGTKMSFDDGTYQDLNRTGQQASDIYQPLSHQGNSMAMKNIFGVTQSQA